MFVASLFHLTLYLLLFGIYSCQQKWMWRMSTIVNRDRIPPGFSYCMLLGIWLQWQRLQRETLRGIVARIAFAKNPPVFKFTPGGGVKSMQVVGSRGFLYKISELILCPWLKLWNMYFFNAILLLHASNFGVKFKFSQIEEAILLEFFNFSETCWYRATPHYNPTTTIWHKISSM